MKFTDILELAKKGYTPNDIKELIELSKESESDSENQGDAHEDGGESDHTTHDDSKPTESDENEETIDYKKLYEEEHEKLLNAQKTNLNQNMNNNSKTDEDIIEDLFKNLK